MNRKLLNSELNRLSIDQFKAAPHIPVVLVLDNVRSQFNIGAAFRTADAFAAEKICLCGICATPPTAEIHKSALGAEFSVEWEYFENTIEAVKGLKAGGYTVLSVEQAENSISLTELKLPLKQSASLGQSFVSRNSRVKADVDDALPAPALPSEKYALVFGNEVHGVQQEVVDLSDAVLEIPQRGTKHSINVSVSIGVVLWEFFLRYFTIFANY